MKLIHRADELRDVLPGANTCVLVPTMGNLHDGHLSLVQQARHHGLPVVVSIFVNRLQFAPHEDFDRYPRTLARDAELLQGVGCDVVFAPGEQQIYPQAQRVKVLPDPALADILEGEFRPGFFTGVATVVMKLFAMVQPRIAIFGKKDYQQLLIIQQMVQQLALSIVVEGGETQRTSDGLALSSRNSYLNEAQRYEATALQHTLRHLAQAYGEAPETLAALEDRAIAALSVRGWKPDYITVRRRIDLLPPAPMDARGSWVALGAARLGDTRLIDNFEF